MGAYVPGAFVGGEDAADEGWCFGDNSFESFNVDGIYADSHDHELHLYGRGGNRVLFAVSLVLSLARFVSFRWDSVKYDA